MANARPKKWLAVFLAFVLVLALIPGAALAAEDDGQPEGDVPCQLTEGCTLKAGHEGECVPEEVQPVKNSVDSEPQAAADDGVNTAEEFAAALEAGGEVTLTGSFEISEKMDIVVTSPVTLNLNGNTVTKSYSEINHYFIVIKDGGSLTVNGTNGGKLEATGRQGYGIQLQSGGTLIVNSGTLEANQEVIDIDDGSSNIKVEINGGVIKNTASDSAINIREGAVVDITGGEIIAPGNNALFVNSYGVSPQINISGGTLTGGKWTVYVSQGADVTVSGDASLSTTGNTGAIYLDGSSYYPSNLLIEGGTIEGDYVAVDVEGNSQVTMTGGSITTNRSAAMELSENASADISGGVLTTTASSAALNVTGSNAKAEISGGTFTGGGANKTALSGSADQIIVTGGTFSSDVNTYVYEGLNITQDDNGNYIVTRLETVYINGSRGNDSNTGADSANAVKTLEHALELVADGGTIYVCGQVSVNSSLTVSGVTIKRADGYTGKLINVAGAGTELTISNATVDGNNDGANHNYLVLVQSGTVLNIEDGARLINNTAAAVGVYSATVNMTGGEISGNESYVDAGGFYISDGNINLTGGEIKNNSAAYAGGGVCFLGEGTLTVDGTKITGNSAMRGGGIYIESMDGDATLTMRSGEISGNELSVQYDEDDYPWMADGAGICAWYGDSSTNTVVDIQGGIIANNIAENEKEDTDGAGEAISLNGGGYGYPELRLGGEPSISGDVYLWDDEAEGPVIKVSEGFAPAAPVTVGANWGSAGTIAVQFPENMTAAEAEGLFASDNRKMMLAADGQDNALAWLDLIRVSFKAPDNRTTYKSVYIRPGALIDQTLIPVVGEGEDKVTPPTGYGVAHWVRYGSTEPWDFETETVPESGNITLLVVWKLNAPTVSVTASDETPHIGSKATLTAETSHELDSVTYAYQWYRDGAAIADATGSTLEISEAGDYTVKVTASDGTKLSGETESTAVEITLEDHTFGSWTQVESPSCTDKGSIKRVCTICGFTETADVDPTGHEWEEEYTVDKAATCTEAGSKSIHCKNCDAVKDSEIIPAAGHTAGTEWKSDKDGHWHECTACGAEIDAASHEFKWVIDKAATATEKGLKHEECTVCGYKKDAVEIAASGTEKPEDPNTPQTGDSFNLTLWLTLAAAVGLLLTAVTVLSERKRKGGR